MGAKRNKDAGHAWEVEVRDMLHDSGAYPDESIITCRFNNRRDTDAPSDRHVDNLCVDLKHRDESTMGIMRDSIQCKTTAKHLDYVALLAEIQRPNGVIFVRKTSARGKTRVQLVDGKLAITDVDRYLHLMACERFVEEVKTMVAPPGEGSVDAVWSNHLRERITKLGL